MQLEVSTSVCSGGGVDRVVGENDHKKRRRCLHLVASQQENKKKADQKPVTDESLREILNYLRKIYWAVHNGYLTVRARIPGLNGHIKERRFLHPGVN